MTRQGGLPTIRRLDDSESSTLGLGFHVRCQAYCTDHVHARFPAASFSTFWRLTAATCRHLATGVFLPLDTASHDSLNLVGAVNMQASSLPAPQLFFFNLQRVGSILCGMETQ